MVSANPTGPITVASARNGAYGDSVARLLEFAGHDVEREYYYNDAGAQMDALPRVGRGAAARRGAAGGRLPGRRTSRELAALDGDPVPPMLEQIEATLERFRVHFDSWALQSELEQRLPELLPRLDTYEKDGALWARSSGVRRRQGPRAHPLATDGAPTYRAADVAYLVDKLERGFDRAIYVLGADHHGDAQLVRRDRAHARLRPGAGRGAPLPARPPDEGGEQTKMSKRRGDVVFLDEFMDEIGVDAARWYLVNRGPDQTIEIDVDLAAEKSQKNPVYYVQYAHARIAGILRNAGGRAGLAELQPAARARGARARSSGCRVPGVVAEATERRGPQAIPTYAIRVADDFHRFYHEHRVLESEQQAFRLALCRATQTVIARCLDLIGVEAPERM